MPRELMFLRQLVNFDVLLQLAFIVGIFAIVLFRRDSIVSLYRFRLACLIFVMSLVLPVIFQPIVQAAIDGSGTMPFSGRQGIAKLDSNFFLQLLVTALGPVLFGWALMLCIGSMLPKINRAAESAVAKPIAPHPLD